MSIATKLASKSVFMFALRIFGAGFVFVVQAAIARVWGAEALGDYLLVIAAANLLAVGMPLGFQTVGTYFAAEYRARGEGRQLRRFLLQAYGQVAAVGIAVALAGWPVTYLMGDSGADLRLLWLPTSVIAIATAVSYVNATTLVGLKRPLAGYVPDMIFRPALMLGGFAVVAAVTQGPQLLPMLWLVALLLLALFVGQFAFVVRAVRVIPADDTPRPSEQRRWWRFAAPWVLIVLASDYFFDINLLLLADLLDRGDLAIFGVSTRIFALVSFGVVAVYSLTLPDMFEAEAKSDRSAFESRVGEANLVATLLALGLFLGVLIFGRFILMLFGDDFTAGALPMAILCLALVVRAMFGPASLVLSMHDQPYASLPSILLGVVVLVAGNYLLVPAHGLMGAAVSAFVAISVWSVSLWLTALVKAKVDVSIFNRFRAAPA
ncbi:lipopolysaccharide biosynthesis protein [Pelagibacterium limicola]|uniref:lipopolysaccharide biosynthesis protein n=1 Tax=Pelagibacterium limicola TaxID=2791022 RepID=UPI0018AFA5A5|nr:polysaccharide biosynthesis C-terminal domain-containing protein [Pelagibacterium limicola]